jgi:hypothetical protein
MPKFSLPKHASAILCQAIITLKMVTFAIFFTIFLLVRLARVQIKELFFFISLFTLVETIIEIVD